MLFGHGNDCYDKGTIVADFSSNVLSGKVDERLLSFLQNRVKDVGNYPHPIGGEFQTALSNFHHTSSESLLVTNGATEAIYLIAQLFKQKRSLIFTPSFSEYESACSMFGHTINYLNALEFDMDLANYDLVWITNPNNPTGLYLNKIFLEKLISKWPSTTFVIDEAYVDLCEEDISLLNVFSLLPNCIIIKSMTKLFRIPGLRLGYMCAAPKLIEQIKEQKMPWSVNSLAIQAGVYIINNYTLLLPKLQHVYLERAKLQRELDNIPTISTYTSYTNFFLGRCDVNTVAELKAYLIREYGFLIRDCANFRTLSPQHFRIASIDENFNEQLVEAIATYVKNN